MTEDSRAFGTLLPVVACALIDTSGRILVQQRPAGTEMAGLWEFPGGKIEPNEGPEAALIRELLEELAIVIASHDLTPVTFASAPLGARHLVLLLYVCRVWTGEPRALHASALRWMRPEDLNRLPMPPADAPFAAALGRIP